MIAARPPGTLYLCGLGPLPERTATLQTLQALGACDVVYFDGPQEGLEPFLRRYCRVVRAAGPSAARAAERIEGHLRRGESVGLVARVSPLAFGELAAGLLARCRDAGWTLQCLPAMSHADMFLAATGEVLGYEMSGVQLFAHDALEGAEGLNVHQPVFIAFSPALNAPGRPGALRRALGRFYGADHPCRIFSPSAGLTESFPLSALADREMDATAALFLSAVAPAGPRR